MRAAAECCFVQISDTSFVSFHDYCDRLNETMKAANWPAIQELAKALRDAWRDGRRVFLCGNGGSAANAMHISNDFHYGIGKGRSPGLRVQALTANTSIMTCLANDEGYDAIFSRQLLVEGSAGDILVVFSGSGNSPNILRALEQAKELGMRSFAVLGYSGGKAKALADVPIHFAIDDMQISEDTQTIVGHMIMQWLYRHGSGKSDQ
jgi:D-sedoheptulose 7-phosphate isomerase